MPDTPPAAVALTARAATDQLAGVDPSQPITNLRHGVLLCDQLARSDLVPRGLQGKPANIFIVIMAGQEMGLTWPVSLRTIYSPGPGQIGMRGELLLAKLHEAGHEYSWEEDPGESCTFTLERYGADPARKARAYAATFSIDDAIQAGLAKRNANGEVVALSRDGKPMPWMQYSSDMLFWRAASRCVKRAAPEVLMGFEVQGSDGDGRSAPGEVELKPASAVQPPSGPEFERASEEQLRKLDERMRRNDDDEIIRAAGVDPATLHADSPEGGEDPRRVEGAAPVDADLATMDEAQRQWIEERSGRPEGIIDGSAQEGTPRAMDSTLARKEELEQAAREYAEHPPPDEAEPHKAKGQILAERFEALGWDPRKHRADLLRACSVYLRRRVSGSREIETAEVMALAAELSRIQRSYPAEALPVALADKVEEWREQWAEADPEGYQEYAK
jgi:hypothetical protein